MFEKGQLVLCVHDRFHPIVVEWGDRLPRAGCIYRVKRVKWCTNGVTRIPEWGLVLEELNNPDDRLSFSASRFRPVHAEDERQEIVEKEALQT